MMNRALEIVADAEAIRRPAPDPPLPSGFTWQTSVLGGGGGGPFGGRYLAKASIWNSGRVTRFNTEKEAESMQKGLHLMDDTIIEKTYAISGRRGHKLKHQYVIRLTYRS
jgi:hypothetical protein